MKIEKDIHIPQLRALGRPQFSGKYPFAKMDIGDSVYFDCKQSGVAVDGERARVAAAMYGMRAGKKFICRKEGTGVRIWRIDPAPPQKGRFGDAKNQYSKLGYGESVYVECDGSNYNRQRVRVAVQYCTMRTGMCFKSKAEKTGIRIFRAIPKGSK